MKTDTDCKSSVAEKAQTSDRAQHSPEKLRFLPQHDKWSSLIEACEMGSESGAETVLKYLREYERIKQELRQAEQERDAAVDALKLGLTLPDEGSIWSVNPSRMRQFIGKAKAALALVEKGANNER